MRVCCTILVLLIMMKETLAIQTDIENIVKKDVQVRMLKMAPQLSDSWYEVEKPEFLLVRISPNSSSKDFILDSQNNPKRFKRSPGLFSNW